MGRYSVNLAHLFADTVDLSPGIRALDLGCGPGALTGVLIDRVGIAGVSACDPSPSFVAACARRHPGIEVRAGRAEAIPFEDSRFDVAMAQLVLHFVSEPETAARELRRVVREGGEVAACVWDFEQGMEMLRAFWDAARLVDPAAPDEATTMLFGRVGEIADLLASAGFTDITETILTVSSVYETFDELWSGFLAGIGPAGSLLRFSGRRPAGLSASESLRAHRFAGGLIRADGYGPQRFRSRPRLKQSQQGRQAHNC